MRVKMITLAAGPFGVLAAGVEYDVPDELGRGLVKARAATLVGGGAPKGAGKAPEKAPVELATEAPEREVATTRKGKVEEKRRPLPKVMGGG